MDHVLLAITPQEWAAALLLLGLLAAVGLYLLRRGGRPRRPGRRRPYRGDAEDFEHLLRF